MCAFLDHATLLEAGGTYRELYREQYGDGEVETRCADGLVLRDGRCVPPEGGPRVLERVPVG